MCCFSVVPHRWWIRAQPLSVSATHIFARHLSDAWQGLVYELTLSTTADVAMILPLPVRPGAGEGGVEFIDLSSYPDFFRALAAAFPQLNLPRSRSVARSLPRRRLKVHRVGSFDASFVPSVHDFDRLDPRFRLPDAAWGDVPGAETAGFAVFMLRKGRRQAIHPMALRFRRREGEGRLFFPTVHIHDGVVHPTAAFDHLLYAQGRAGGDWEESVGTVRQSVDVERAAGLVDGDASVWRRRLVGERENVDIWL